MVCDLDEYIVESTVHTILAIRHLLTVPVQEPSYK